MRVLPVVKQSLNSSAQPNDATTFSGEKHRDWSIRPYGRVRNTHFPGNIIFTVNIHDAKSRISELVEQLEIGQETEVIIARNGLPVAKLVPYSAPQRIGAARQLLSGLKYP